MEVCRKNGIRRVLSKMPFKALTIVFDNFDSLFVILLLGMIINRFEKFFASKLIFDNAT